MSSDREQTLQRIRDDRWTAKTPPVYRDASVASLPEAVRVKVEKWLSKNPRRTLMMGGPVGTGKTHVAHAVQRHLEVSEDIPCPVWTMAKLLDGLRDQEHGRKLMEQVENAPYIIIDDIGAERGTDWAAERFLMIVDERWKWQRPIIATTNFPLKRDILGAELGDRLASRLLDGAVGIVLSTEDRRNGNN